MASLAYVASLTFPIHTVHHPPGGIPDVASKKLSAQPGMLLTREQFGEVSSSGVLR